MKTLRTVILCLLAASLASAQSVVDVDGRKVRVRIEGSGSPAVVFESGFSDSMNPWAAVFPEVAKMTRAFAYDRAGLGQSEASPAPRSYRAIVSELHKVLEHEKVAPPYVLVGHSYGGALTRVFAATYPAEVAGIVFVDPMTEDLLAKDRAATGKIIAEEDERLKNAPPGIRAEWQALRGEALSDYPLLRAVPKPNVPMTLLISRVDHPEGWVAAEMSRYAPWIEERDDSSMVLTSNSTHYIQRDEPQLVIAAIRSMLYPNPIGVLDRTMRAKGADATVAAFRDMQKRYPAGSITPPLLNTLGYSQLRQKHVDDAIRFFALNVEMFPGDANAYDSLGEAYAVKGDREEALENYRKSLAMDPKNDNARRQIAKLEKM